MLDEIDVVSNVACKKRLLREMEILTCNPVEGIICNLSVNENSNLNDIFHWKACILGELGTPYEDGIFILDILIPNEYPFKLPKVKFDTKIYHQNINEESFFKLGIL